jgi:pilus assembly protein CpaE
MRLTPGRSDLAVDRAASGGSRRVAVVEGALGSPESFASLAALFPQAQFQIVPPTFFERTRSAADVVIVSVASSDAEAASRWLRSLPGQTRILIILRDADVTTSRRLLREGAADVLPAPASETSLALSLERILSQGATAGQGSVGRVVALLKAGGGVGATSLGVQAAALLAAHQTGQVCFADLDVQFGAGAVYMDLPDALTVTDCLSAGSAVAETPFASSLASHSSGVRLLAAAKDVVALDSISPILIEALIRGLRRDIALTIMDLPSVWTAWTNQALHLADQIVLVTHLSVPHIQMVKRQLRMLASQQLDAGSALLVCNAVSPNQTASLSLKAAERALGRPFDVVIPEDMRTMTAAINEGVQISSVRRGTKLEKSLLTFAERLSVGANAQAVAPGR